jgi:chlorophyll synthase
MEKEIIKILRELFIPSAVIVAAFSYLVACVVMGATPTLANLLAVSIFTAALNSFNNYFDIAEDMLSKPTRPLPCQKINPRKSLFLTSILLVSSVLISYENPLSFNMMVAWSLLAILYSVPPIRLKRVPILNTSIIATNYVLLPWLLAWSQITFDFPLLLVAILFIIAFGSVISKDFEDEKADALMNNKTIPVIFGNKKAALITRTLTIGGVMLLMLYLLSYSITASLLCLPAFVTFLYINKGLEKRNGRKTLSREFMIGGALTLAPLLVL